MIQKKNILILCDSHDLIRHENYNYLLLKQLYTYVYLLKIQDTLDELNIHINNRSKFTFGIFFKEGSYMDIYLDKYLKAEKWDQIDFSKYHLIVCLPEYQKLLLPIHLDLQLLNSSIEFYSFRELQFPEEKIFESASSIFKDGSCFAISKDINLDQKLTSFKGKFDQSLKKLSISKLERNIGYQMNLFVKNKSFAKLENLKKIIILDDFQRPFFIGDSVYWFAKLRKLCFHFADHTEITINIINKISYKNVNEIFLRSLPLNVHITNKDWNTINFSQYDLILCNNDIQSKFHWYLDELPCNHQQNIPSFTFSVKDERKVSTSPTLDFYSILNKLGYTKQLLQADHLYDQQKFIGLPIHDDESFWAEAWFKENGISKDNKIIIIFHGASAKNKTLEDIELVKLLVLLNVGDSNIKILLLTYKIDEQHEELRTSICNNPNFNHVIIGDSLKIRDLMSLLIQPNIELILGPCTGHMHLADGIYTHLLEVNEKTKNDIPIILTYAGKQDPERNYHPYNWWKHSKIVDCCVGMINTESLSYLTNHHNCPKDLHAFNESSIFAKDIKAQTLLNFIRHNYPNKMSFIKDNPAPLDKVEIPTYIINLKSRLERRKYILEQFNGKKIFNVRVFEAIEHENGRIGLWKTITKIIHEASKLNYDFVLLCEDDHEFTEQFSEEKLLTCIEEATLLNADILLGGICSYKNCKRISPNLISVNEFACTQFTIVFKKMYKKILDAQFTDLDCADFKLSELTHKKYIIFPFISIQRDFGYSDVSTGYYENKMEIYFGETSRLINLELK
ncbi:hypothetical protein [Sphingobacterium sp. UBA6320]|jgi:hypothetical protein|uniref:hypothetical protein n=1 Tax=Sphingobacterium sp. UBA6320 TaxID=1947510 RepID=UPI0025F65B20|nr:hypothetical protein [Sphingobacterium sp. UBA6320]